MTAALAVVRLAAKRFATRHITGMEPRRILHLHLCRRKSFLALRFGLEVEWAAYSVALMFPTVAKSFADRLARDLLLSALNAGANCSMLRLSAATGSCDWDSARCAVAFVTLGSAIVTARQDLATDIVACFDGFFTRLAIGRLCLATWAGPNHGW